MGLPDAETEVPTAMGLRERRWGGREGDKQDDEERWSFGGQEWGTTEPGEVAKQV